MNVHLLAVSGLSGKVTGKRVAVDEAVASDNAGADTFRERIEESRLRVGQISILSKRECYRNMNLSSTTFAHECGLRNHG